MTTTPDPHNADAELFRPLRPRRAFDELMLRIRSLIDSGKLRPGDRLPSERSLAQQFEVSRNTVREALRMLEISGVVTLRRGAKGGAFIADPQAAGAETIRNLSLTDFSLEDLTDVMRWVCGMTLRAAAPELTEADLAALSRHLDDAETISSDQDRAVFLVDFYALLARAAGNPLLVVIVESLLDILRTVVARLETHDHRHVIERRRQIIALLRERDVDAAAAELDRHLVLLHAMWLKDPGRDTLRVAPTSGR